MTDLGWRVRNEPAVLFSLVEALIALAVAFGLDLSGEQVAGVMAVVAILTGVGVRQTAWGPKSVGDIIDADNFIRQADPDPHEFRG